MATLQQSGLLESVLIAYVLGVALLDWRTHRIPNVLSAAAVIVGTVLQVWLHGKAGVLSALGGAAVGFGMFLPFYVLRAFGAGDVKAMAAVGIFLGFQATVLAVALTLIAGAVLGAFVLLAAPGYASVALYRIIGLLIAPVSTLRKRSDSSPQPRLRFPYGVAIATGTVAAMFFTGRIPF